MNWLAPTWIAEIHREVFSALLKSWIPHGQRGEFARRVGVTREYLSYLCAVESDTQRLPSEDLARRIADNLPAPLEIRQSVIENAELARAYKAQTFYAARSFLHQRRVNELIAWLNESHHRATFGASAEETSRADTLTHCYFG